METTRTIAEGMFTDVDPLRPWRGFGIICPLNPSVVWRVPPGRVTWLAHGEEFCTEKTDRLEEQANGNEDDEEGRET